MIKLNFLTLYTSAKFLKSLLNLPEKKRKYIQGNILTYESQSWSLTERDKNMMKVEELKFLRKIEGKSCREKIPNSTFREF